MAIAPLLPSPPLAAVDAVRQIHGVLDRVDPAAAATTAGAGEPGGGDLSAQVAARGIAEVDTAIRRLQGLRLSMVAAADRGQVATEAGMSGTGAWLAAQSRADGAAASRDVGLATALDTELSATRQALAAGEVSPEHAQVIATATAALPGGLSDADRAAVEASLVAKAKLLDPAGLRKASRRALAEAEATTAAQVDAHQDKVLRTEEDAALAKTRLSLHDNGDGTTTGHFTVPTLTASILRKIVQQMASPRRFAQRAAEQAKDHATTHGTTPTATEVNEAQWDAFRTADGDWAHRYGQAFVELLEHLPTDKLSGKVAATVVVTIDHTQLQDNLGAAHLDTGHDLSASQARRLACNAGILPAILDGTSLPLDLGRQNRFFTENQRIALATTYDTCAADGCDRPYAWSELHHEDPWHTGGDTDLHLAVPLCGHHHRRAHDPTYHHHIHTDTRGKKSVTFSRRT